MTSQEYWEKQSKSFDESADYYDQFRPGYPGEMITDLLKKTQVDSNSNILEIGAGSGKATQQLVERGLKVTCLEPGVNLARAGERKFKDTSQVQYLIQRFEDWQGEEQEYDLILSAQAFHWVPQPLGYQKSHQLLKPGGYMGLFWNFYLAGEESICEELRKLFKTYPLAYLDSQEELDQRITYYRNGLESCGLFKQVELFRYPWSKTYTAHEYLGFVRTGNGWLTMGPEVQREAESRVTEIFAKHGGVFTKRYICTLYLAIRSG